VTEPADIIVPVFCVIPPGLIVIAIAYIRTRYYHGVDYRLNSKNLAAFFAILSIMFLFEKIIYSIMHHVDVYGITTFSIMLIVTATWYKLSKEKLEVKAIAKIQKRQL
jgi:uncharacterized membrane protein (DUF2068 family)